MRIGKTSPDGRQTITITKPDLAQNLCRNHFRISVEATDPGFCTADAVLPLEWCACEAPGVPTVVPPLWRIHRGTFPLIEKIFTDTAFEAFYLL